MNISILRAHRSFMPCIYIMTEIKVDIFDYVIKNYSDELVLKDNEEYKTLSIGDDIDKDTCELIEVIDESEKGDNIIR